MEQAFEEYWEAQTIKANKESSQLLVLAFKEVAQAAFYEAWKQGERAGFAQGYLTKK